MNKKQKIEDWFIQKTYLHFDTPLSFVKASSIVKNPDYISKHPFLPFLSFDVTTIKYKKNLVTQKKEKKIKTRPICYSSHVDGYIYNYYATKLLTLYEEKINKYKISDSILAFRKLDSKSNIHFAKQAFDDILHKGSCTAIALDFSDFFNNLNHDILKKEWCKLLKLESLPNDHFNIYKSLTKYSIVDKKEVYELFSISKNNYKNRPLRICSIKEFRENVRKKKCLINSNPNISMKKGIPQGSSLSALLSNIYMIEFDKKMHDYIKNLNGKYYRYCDDILIIVDTDNTIEVEDYTINVIKELKLNINSEKTLKSEFKLIKGHLFTEKELQYLGFLFDGRNINIRSSSISRYYQKLKKSILLSKKTMNKYNNIRVEKGMKDRPMFKRKLYEKFSHLGESNFITYALRAKKIMNSSSIKKQIKKISKNFNKKING